MKQFLFAMLFLYALTPQAQAATLTPVKDYEGLSANTSSAAQIIMRNDSDWLSTFSQLVSPTSVPIKPPGTIGVGLFLGARGTSGYKINILGIHQMNNKIYVDFEEGRVPGSPFGTSPYRVLALPVTNPQLEVVFTQNMWDWWGGTLLEAFRFCQDLVFRVI